MCNKLLKGVASVLGAALLLGSVVMSAVPAQAATSVQGADGYETTYTVAELTLVTNSETASVDGQKFSYTSQYSQIFYAIPQEVMDAGLIAWKCAPGSDGAEFALKIVNDTDLYTDIAVSYSSLDSYPMIEAGSRATANTIDFMNLAEGDNTITIAGATFVTEKAVAGAGAASASEETKKEEPAKAETAAPAPTTSSKTGEAMTNVWLVCALGGLLLIAATGMVVTEQKKRR